MQRVPLENRAQKDKFGPGKHGYQGGNPTTGVLATIPGAEAFDCFQEEIANVIENAGIQLDGKNYQQLYQAIVQLITEGGRLPLAGYYSSSKKYLPGTLLFLDGEWYECYHPDGCKGKDPRDPANRPVGWKNTDTSKPYFWLKIGPWLSFPETGSPIYLPTTGYREGIIRYRNDGNLHKDKFWRLALLYPNLVSNNVIKLADLRGEFIRGLDEGRKADPDYGRGMLSSQGDAIRNITGGFRGVTGGGHGAFVYKTNADGLVHFDDNRFTDIAEYTFSASKVVPTASENRPRNIAMLAATRI